MLLFYFSLPLSAEKKNSGMTYGKLQGYLCGCKLYNLKKVPSNWLMGYSLLYYFRVGQERLYEEEF